MQDERNPNMASNNNDTRKKQKRTVVDGNSSPSSTTLKIVPALSFGNILQYFPDLLIHGLPYIADRAVFNSITSCNKYTHEKSKAILPPWPKDYQLPASDRYSIAVWAPDGTRVAYRCSSAMGIRDGHAITIVDQRHGIIHHINHDVDFTDLKFSSDGRLLVSVDDDHIVKLWDNNVAGNYGLLQECNVREDIDGIGRGCAIDISACSKYIVVATNTYMRNRVVIKRVEDGEIVRSLTPQPGMVYIPKVFFYVDYRAVLICGTCGNSSVIKLWLPYQDDADEDSLITLWEHKDFNYNAEIFISHKKRMIAIQHMVDPNKGWLLSIDNNYSCTVQGLNVPGSVVPDLLQFTPDDECIIYVTEKGLKYWNVAERKFTQNKEHVFDKGKTMNNPYVRNFSPNNCQFLVFEDYKKYDLPLCMKSIS